MFQVGLEIINDVNYLDTSSNIRGLSYFCIVAKCKAKQTSSKRRSRVRPRTEQNPKSKSAQTFARHCDENDSDYFIKITIIIKRFMHVIDLRRVIG